MNEVMFAQEASGEGKVQRHVFLQDSRRQLNFWESEEKGVFQLERGVMGRKHVTQRTFWRLTSAILVVIGDGAGKNCCCH